MTTGTREQFSITSNNTRTSKQSKKQGNARHFRLLASLAALAFALCIAPLGWAGGTGGSGGTSFDGAGSGGTGSDGTATNANGATGGSSTGMRSGGQPGQSGAAGDGLGISVGGGGGNAVSSPYAVGGSGPNFVYPPYSGGAGGALGAAVSSSTVISTAVAGTDGSPGSDGPPDPGLGSGTGGGGGGDGVIYNGTGTLVVQQSVVGGDGGNGGNSSPIFPSPDNAGGGGGGGGAGLVATGNALLDISAHIDGGNGGNGGDAPFSNRPGSGGGGGVGVAASNSEIQIKGTGAIAGGNGGTGGNVGQGGVGVLGENLSVVTAGSISGGMAGDGTTRANAIVFTAGTNTLELQNGYSITGNVAANGTTDTLVLGGNSDSSFDVNAIGSTGQYQGFEQFEKTGSSTWTLTGTGAQAWTINAGTLVQNGTNTSTGTTQVNAGRLIVGSDAAHSSASIAGDVQVASGATIGGHGSIGGLTVSGTVAPGNSIGTLTVNGSYTAEPGSVYTAEVDAAGNHDLIKVTGHAVLNGGTVDVQASNGNYAPSTNYTLLTADGGVTGRYDSVTSSLAFLTPSLSYDPHDVILTLARNDTDFGTVADTPNQRAAAVGLESLGSGSALYNSIIGLSAPDARSVFDATSGEVYASTQSALLEDSRYVRDSVSDRLSVGCVGAHGKNPNDISCGHNIWARAYGDWGHTSGDGNAAQLDHDVSGILLGADTAVHNWRVGILGGYSHGHSSVDARDSSSSDDSYQLGAYAGTRKGRLNLNVGAAYAWHDIGSRRNVDFSGYNDPVSGSYNANTTQLFGEVGYDVDYGRTTLTPFARAAYIHLDTDSFDETGGTAALHDSGKSNDLTVSTLGVRASRVLRHTEATTIRAHGMAGWRHAYSSTTPEADLAFNGGEQFTVAGVPVARDALAVAAGVDIQVKRNLSVGVDYVGQFGGGVESNGIRLSLMRHF